MNEQDLIVYVNLYSEGRLPGHFSMFIGKTENRQLVLKRPFISYPFISALSTKESVQEFENSLFKAMSIPELNMRVGIHADHMSAKNFKYPINKEVFGMHIEHLMTYRKKFVHTGEKLELGWSSRLSREDLLRFYEGEFNSEGKKQGKWTWRYSNGNLLAETEFDNDSIVGSLKMYGFKGSLLDSIPSGDRQLRYSSHYAPGTGPDEWN
jgi:hypothetical protein